MRKKSCLRGISRAKIDVQISVVVDVAEVGAHGHEYFIEANFRGYIFKGSVVLVAVELQGLFIVRAADVRLERFVHRGHEAIHEKIRPAVIVVIKKPCSKTKRRRLNSCLPADLSKREITVVVIQKIDADLIRYVEIRKSVAIIISGNDSFTEGRLINVRSVANLLECSVAFVVEELSRRIFIGDKEIEISIVVDVCPRCCLGGGYRCH